MNDPDTHERRARIAAALSERFGETITVPEALPGLEELERIARHSSHRRWRDEAVDAEVLRLVCACALAAPSKSDLQQADIIEVRDPDKKRALATLVPTLPWFADAPVVLVFCGNGRRFRRLFSRRDRPFVNEHLDAFFNPTVDAALVMMNFLRAAAAVGLACCPISILRNRPSEVAQILALPDHVFPVAGMCVGYPVFGGRIVPRLPLAATLHVDTYADAAVDALIDAYDQRRLLQEREQALSAGREPPQACWSQAKLKQYSEVQRADWAEFVRAQGFSLD